MADGIGKGGGGGGLDFGSFKLGSSTFSNIGGAVNDIFSSQAGAKSLEIKAAGDIAEGQQYDLAGKLARQNAAFTEQSTAIKTMQQEREVNLALGGQQAAVAASGFEQSGSALDLLRDSAAQGALQKAVLQQQGLITEAGYKEQAESYDIMKNAAFSAAQQEKDLASKEKTAGYIGAALKVAGAVASVL